ncbi:heat shock 70 kDa protein 12A-like [Ruditapes philippinarum]|uniref:heat shock 70 kDa protein 12A-like n=1 Tax=Ruditapes philippinarum TaxID=129788 RepID=UPI00295B333A|nr:heat shock 70 kDa protein 12A-like [Ruditapes philippinarum]
MREAAVEADIRSEYLSLALEPEAASMFCKLLPVDCLKLNSSKFVETFKPGTSYIVLDLGGGTVDLTVHHIEYDGRLSEIARASGGAWGGTQVDEAYLKFLEELFCRCVFQAFRENNTSDFLEMLREFEINKNESVKEAFSNKRIIVPSEPGLAVLKGAVLFGHDPLVMKSRVSKYTYGIEIIDKFVEGLSPERYRVFENGIYKCRYTFCPFVRAGELVPVGKIAREHLLSDTFDVKEALEYMHLQKNIQSMLLMKAVFELELYTSMHLINPTCLKCILERQKSV